MPTAGTSETLFTSSSFEKQTVKEENQSDRSVCGRLTMRHVLARFTGFPIMHLVLFTASAGMHACIWVSSCPFVLQHVCVKCFKSRLCRLSLVKARVNQHSMAAFGSKQIEQRVILKLVWKRSIFYNTLKMRLLKST